MPENLQQYIEAASRIRHYKGETSSVNGPLFLDDKPYWSIYFIKKSFLKGLRGVTLIVLNEKGEIIKDWRIYKRVAITYLMPRISEKFFAHYLNEVNEVVKMSDFFKNSQESLHESKIAELLEKAKARGANELADHLTYFKMQMVELEKRTSKILNYTENTKNVVNELLKRSEYSTMAKFVKRFSCEEKGIARLKKNIAEQVYIIFNMASAVRELGIQKEESKRFIESINKYMSVIRQMERTIDRMIKTRQYLLHLHTRRKNKIKEFYREMLKRT
jgi:hypothetical protein